MQLSGTENLHESPKGGLAHLLSHVNHTSKAWYLTHSCFGGDRKSEMETPPEWLWKGAQITKHLSVSPHHPHITFWVSGTMKHPIAKWWAGNRLTLPSCSQCYLPTSAASCFIFHLSNPKSPY
jgi:hypothetical protein